MARFVRRMGLVLLGLGGLLLSALLVLAVVSALVTAQEKSTLKPPGRLVSVGTKQMHVLTSGSRGSRVVFLPGGGNPAPAVDFAPLVQRLEGRFQVSVVEPLGYGWSEGTDEPRTLDRQLDEVRSALRAAGQSPPYVLVPHSISGLVVLLWVKLHPEEVQAIVGLDPSVPEMGPFFPSSTGPNGLGLLRTLGVVRLALALEPGLVDAQTPALDARGRWEFLTLTNWNFHNDTTHNEQQQIRANCLLAQDLTIPEVPTTFLLSRENTSEDQGLGFSWLAAHERQIEGNPRGKIVVVDGSHYFYRDHLDVVVSQIEEIASPRP